jgi:hypothetical protein
VGTRQPAKHTRPKAKRRMSMLEPHTETLAMLSNGRRRPVSTSSSTQNLGEPHRARIVRTYGAV